MEVLNSRGVTRNRLRKLTGSSYEVVTRYYNADLKRVEMVKSYRYIHIIYIMYYGYHIILKEGDTVKFCFFIGHEDDVVLGMGDRQPQDKSRVPLLGPAQHPAEHLL